MKGEVQATYVPERKSLITRRKKGQRFISLLKGEPERLSNLSSSFSGSLKREDHLSHQGTGQQPGPLVHVQQQQQQQQQQRVVQHQVISHNLQQHNHLQQQQQLDQHASIQLHLPGSSLQQSLQSQHQSLPITTVLHHTNHLHEPVNSHQDHHQLQGLLHQHHVFPQQQLQHQQNSNIHVSLQPSHQ
ncbi:hypothetical protein FHG87_025907, partial [Trinorchestia longiramus]